MEQLIVEATVDVQAPPEQVFRVLTEPAFTRAYMFGCEAVSTWRPGSALEWRAEVDGRSTVMVRGRVLAIEPGRYLSYTTFAEGMGLADLPENHVTVTCRLTPLSGGGTRLSVTQGDFAGQANGRERYEHTRAYWPQALASIQALAERGTAAAVAG